MRQLVGTALNRVVTVDKNNISNELCSSAASDVDGSSSSEYTDERKPLKSKRSSNSESTYSIKQ